MFWADKVANDIKKTTNKPQWVDDMKTPSGRIHVGSLLGVVVHDLAYKALVDAGFKATYTYVFENHDPMDDIPSYLPREKYEKYLGMPLFAIPSPEEGYKDFASYYAQEFQETFNAIGCHPKILWTKDLYTEGKMNDGIKKCLDAVEDIRKIYHKLYDNMPAKDWYPFQVYCEKCGKVSTTKVFNWDGEKVHYTCAENATDWTKGCGHEGKVTPFSDKNNIRGKLPWKVEWAVKWQAIGVTVEGAGKDHMSRGGSHDLASLVCKQVLNYPVPHPIPYEFILIGGKKMSSSKGRGHGAADMLEILPPELLRFLMVRMNIKRQMNFDPTDSQTIPKLFDDYQEYAKHYFEKKEDDYARIFELSQIDKVKKPPTIRFLDLAKLVQQPGSNEKIKEEGASDWAKYAKYWIDNFAPEEDKIALTNTIPQSVEALSDKQKELLKHISENLEKEWETEQFQKQIYDWGKELGLNGKQTFSAIYQALLGKNFGPKAAEFILAQDKNLIKQRFEKVSSL